MANWQSLNDAYWQLYAGVVVCWGRALLKTQTTLTYRGDKSRERFHYIKKYRPEKNPSNKFYEIILAYN